MTLREKIAHVHRRLGFGATPVELDRDEKLGLGATIDRLIDYDSVDEQFPVSPYEFCWRTSTKEEADLGTYRFRIYWAFRMLASKRPLQEKLTLFWSGHFAVGDDKVEDGPMMLDYIEGLRKNANSKFSNLLDFASKAPAMMRYLDMTRSVRGNPNENFAREVMELFTLGINGGYTEKDVQEVARALTGWGFIHMFYELPGDSTAKVREMLKYDRPFTSFAYMPAMHDPTPKTILGQTKNWTGDEVLLTLANHPSTAHFVCRKLLTYFAYENPESAYVDKIANVFVRSRGDIKTVLRAIMKSPEFWSDKCVGQLIKTPADFVIGIARTQGLGDELMKLRDPKATEHTEIPRKIMDESGYVVYRMDRMGLSLMIPPNVAGWNWGSSFVNPAVMPERFQYVGNFIQEKGKPNKASQHTIGWVASKKPKTSDEAATLYCELFGLSPTVETLSTLDKLIDRHGGPKAFEDEKQWDSLTYNLMRFLVAAPEMHVC